jgi:hypothetical protein
MKWETKTRGRELPGMEALSFMVLVAHGGVGVAAADCGGKHWFSFFSSLLWCVVFFLCFLFPLSTVFLPLCSGFVEVLLVLTVLLVVAKRKTGGGTRRTLLRFLCIFFFFLLPSVVLLSAFCLFHLFFVHSHLSLSLLAFLSFSYSPLFPSLSLFLLCSTLLSLPPFFFGVGIQK